MATYTDTFTEGTDTALASHTPDSGGTWTEQEDSAGTITVDVVAANDTISPSATSGSNRVVYTVSWTPASAEYDVSITRKTGVVGADDPVWLVARFTDTSNFYAGGSRNSTAVTDKEIIKVVAGVRTSLSTADSGFAVNDVLMFEVRNAAKKLYHNAVEVASTTDDTLTSAGVCGIAFGNVGPTTGDDIHSGWEMDDFSLVDAAGVGGGGAGPLIGGKLLRRGILGGRLVA